MRETWAKWQSTQKYMEDTETVDLNNYFFNYYPSNKTSIWFLLSSNKYFLQSFTIIKTVSTMEVFLVWLTTTKIAHLSKRWMQHTVYRWSRWPVRRRCGITALGIKSSQSRLADSRRQNFLSSLCEKLYESELKALEHSFYTVIVFIVTTNSSCETYSISFARKVQRRDQSLFRYAGKHFDLDIF